MGRRVLCVGIVLFLISLLLAVQPAAAERGAIGVTPTRFDVEATPGAEASGEILVTNEGAVPFYVKTIFSDRVVAQGQVHFLDPGHSTWSAARWLAVDQPEFELAPGGSRKVKWVLQVPELVEPGDRTALIFFHATPLTAVQPGAVAVTGQVGALLVIKVPGPLHPGAEITSLEVWPESIGIPFLDWELTLPSWLLSGEYPIYLRATVQNQGNVRIPPAGQVQFYDFWQKQVDLVPVVGSSTIYPGDEGEVWITWQNPPFLGEYTAAVLLEYGGEKPLVAYTTFYIVPWQILMGLPLLALGLFFLLRRTRGKGQETAK
ncbi:MAG: hypothetical protein ACE5NP_01940 [Anaerolineae bacterium]